MGSRSTSRSPRSLPASPETAIKDVHRLIAEAYEGQWQYRDGLLGVGMAVGGPVNPINGKVVRAGGMPTWAGVDMRELFGPIFPDVPIFCDNESNCAAIAEMIWGAAQGHEDFILYTLDVGIGGAIVAGGKVQRGIAGGAGEFGHVVLDPNGPLCRCGNRGCVEVYANFRDALSEAEQHFGRSLRIADVVEMALAGDETCRRLIERTAEAGATGSASSARCSIPPDRGQRTPRSRRRNPDAAARAELRTLLTGKHGDVPDSARTTLRPSAFTDNGACMGAVGLVLRHHGRLMN